VKSHSEKDVWQEVRKAERLHGDKAEVRLAERIDELTRTKDFEKVSFWSALADPDPIFAARVLGNFTYQPV
jgi:hypothetical protein